VTVSQGDPGLITYATALSSTPHRLSTRTAFLAAS
jgi:hypothetical protein